MTINHGEEYAKCATNEWYWMCNYVKIVDRRTGQIIPFQPWEHLRIAWETYRSNTRIVILKARQVGMSWFWAAIALHRGLFKEYSNTIMLSINQEKAGDLRNKSFDIWNHLPKWQQLPTGKDNMELLTFPEMESQIKSLPAKPNSVRGESSGLIILDEWAFHEYDYESWTAVLLAAELGTIVGLSTANGRNNKFYDVWDDAEKGVNNFIPLFFPWNVVPERGEEWYQTQARDLKPWERRQELPSDKDDAFIIAGDCYFDVELLREIQQRCPQPSRQGNVEVYTSVEDGHTYSVGLDTSLGVVGGDYSCAQFIDNATGEHVAKLRGRIPPEQFAEELHAKLMEYNKPFLLIEELPTGRVIYNQLVALGYPKSRMYHRNKTTPCWYTSAKNRPQILSQLETGVRLDQLHIKSRTTIDEMFSFGWNEKQNKFQALSGHDDEVMSLALAWYAKTDAYKPLGDLKPRKFVKPRTSLNPGTSFSWKKRNPMEGLQVLTCTACEGSRLVTSEEGRVSVCGTCKGAGSIIERD